MAHARRATLPAGAAADDPSDQPGHPAEGDCWPTNLSASAPAGNVADNVPEHDHAERHSQHPRDYV